MSSLKSIYEKKRKLLAEDIETVLTGDVLQSLKDEPLSTEKDKKEEKEFVPGGEIIRFHDLKDDIKSIFKKVIIFATDEANHPESFDPVGYCFSIIYKKRKAIDFSGSFLLTTNEVEEEFYMSLKQKDNRGSQLFYRITNIGKYVAMNYADKNK